MAGTQSRLSKGERMTHAELTAAVKASLNMSDSKTERHASYPAIKPKAG
jgi:hypothetical protein